jgi:hypothetical protein
LRIPAIENFFASFGGASNRRAPVWCESRHNNIKLLGAYNSRLCVCMSVCVSKIMANGERYSTVSMEDSGRAFLLSGIQYK